MLAALRDADCGLHNPQPEQLAQPGGLMSIDIVGQHVDAAGTTWQVAVEVDGPTHFVRHLSACDEAGIGTTHSQDGSTLWRNAMLQHYGYAVVMVPYQEWGACSSRAQRVALLQQRIRAALLAAGVQPGGVLAGGGAGQ